MKWLGRVRVARVEQVQQRFRLARSKAYGRLQGLRELGLVRLERAVPGPAVFVATRKGLTVAEVELAAAVVNLESLKHDLAAAGVVAALERELGSGWTMLSEREIRARQHRTRDDRHVVKVEDGPVRLARHVPDLALHHGELWLAIEVELTQKSAERLKRILRDYRRHHANGLWRVLYLVPTERRAQQLTRLAAGEMLAGDGFPVLFAARALGPAGATAGALHDVLQGRRAAVERHEREQAELQMRRQQQAEAEERTRVAQLEEYRRREARRAAEAREAARLSNRVKRRLAG